MLYHLLHLGSEVRTEVVMEYKYPGLIINQLLSWGWEQCASALFKMDQQTGALEWWWWGGTEHTEPSVINLDGTVNVVFVHLMCFQCHKLPLRRHQLSARNTLCKMTNFSFKFTNCYSCRRYIVYTYQTNQISVHLPATLVRQNVTYTTVRTWIDFKSHFNEKMLLLWVIFF